jgi:hypothetical protein
MEIADDAGAASSKITGLAALCVSLASTAFAEDPKLAMESYLIPSADSGIQLYIRNKHPAGVTTFPGDKIRRAATSPS